RLAVGRLVQALRAEGEDLAAVFGDADGVFELGGQALVAGDGSPAVAQHLYRGLAEVDHRLDRHEHARLQLRPGAGAAGMDHFRRVMKQAADSVAAEIAHHAVAMAFRMPLNCRADVTQMVAGPRL